VARSNQGPLPTGAAFLSGRYVVSVRDVVLGVILLILVLVILRAFGLI